MNCKSTNVLSQDSGVMCGRVCHKGSELVKTLGDIWMLQEMGKREKGESVCIWGEAASQLPHRSTSESLCAARLSDREVRYLHLLSVCTAFGPPKMIQADP